MGIEVAIAVSSYNRSLPINWHMPAGLFGLLRETNSWEKSIWEGFSCVCPFPATSVC